MIVRDGRRVERNLGPATPANVTSGAHTWLMAERHTSQDGSSTGSRENGTRLPQPVNWAVRDFAKFVPEQERYPND